MRIKQYCGKYSNKQSVTKRWDGDTVTLTVIMDKYMYERAKMLEPQYYVMDLNRPFSVGPYCKNTGEAKSTLRHWMESDFV